MWKNNSPVNVSSQPAKGSTGGGMANAALSQSLPKAMLEGYTGWRQNRLNEREVIEAPRAPHFAPIKCVCQSVKVQGPFSGSKERRRGQKGLVWLTNTRFHLPFFSLTWGIPAAGLQFQVRAALMLESSTGLHICTTHWLILNKL